MQLRCLNCDEPLEPGWALCPQCGAAVDGPAPLPRPGRLLEFLRGFAPAAFWPGALLTFLGLSSLHLLLSSAPPLWSKAILGVVLSFSVVALAGYLSELMRQTLAEPESTAPGWPADGHLSTGFLVTLVVLAYLLFPLLAAGLLVLLVGATLGSLHTQGATLTGGAAVATLTYITLLVGIVLVALMVVMRQLYLIPLRVGFFAAFERFAKVEQHQQLVRVYLPRWKLPYVLLWLITAATLLLLGSCYLVARLSGVPLLAEAFTAPFAFAALALLCRWFALVFYGWLPQLGAVAHGPARENLSQLLRDQLKVILSSSHPTNLRRR